MKRTIVVAALAAVVGWWAGQATVVARAEVEEPNTELEAILAADREFDQVTAEQGAEGWVSFFSEHGSMYDPAAPPVTGHEAIQALMGPVFSSPDYSLRWQPDHGEILLPGRLGYTTGPYQRRSRDREGNLRTGTGRYVSFWYRQKDGSWKVLFDTGASDPAPAR